MAMKLHRRTFLHLAAGAAALPAFSRIARGQAYPSRPVRIIVGFAAGGPTDIVARLIGQWLSERLGQQFVIENRPGANANLATETAVRSPPDGHTLLFVVTSNAVNASLYDKLNFAFLRDIIPVAGLTQSPFFLLANPTFSTKTVPEIIARAKADPGKLNIGGASSIAQVAVELFKRMAGVDILYVPYRGDAPGLINLMGGQLEMYLGGAIAAIEQTKAGTLRALATTAATRSEAVPDVPTIAEFVPGYEAISFYGIGAPRGTPTPTIDKLNREIGAALADPKIKARLADLAATPMPLSPEDFGKFVAGETEKWGNVIRAANIKPE